jgi:hypothetical protein
VGGVDLRAVVAIAERWRCKRFGKQAVSAVALAIPSMHDHPTTAARHRGIGTLKLLSAMDLPTAAQLDAGEADSVDELIRRLRGGARASPRRCFVPCSWLSAPSSS